MKKEEMKKKLLASKEHLEKVLANLDNLKDDEEGSVTLQGAFHTKTIQISDLFEVEEGSLSVGDPCVGFIWGLKTRGEGPLTGKAFLLSERYDWDLGRDRAGMLCLVPIKKK